MFPRAASTPDYETMKINAGDTLLDRIADEIPAN
jgi:hypothetical protein